MLETTLFIAIFCFFNSGKWQCTWRLTGLGYEPVLSWSNELSFQIRRGIAELSLDPADGQAADIKIKTTSLVWREILCQVRCPIIKHFQFQTCLFGPRIFTIVNLKQRPTTTILSYATMAHALSIVVEWQHCYISTAFKNNLILFRNPKNKKR